VESESETYSLFFFLRSHTVTHTFSLPHTGLIPVQTTKNQGIEVTRSLFCLGVCEFQVILPSLAATMPEYADCIDMSVRLLVKNTNNGGVVGEEH
jgi:hypothetical protein